MIIVVPRIPTATAGSPAGPPAPPNGGLLATWSVPGGRAVAVYDLENERGTPVYVHAKAVIVDDVWAMVGSANLNRRSWTHDSEVACAVLDQERDPRPPVDPGGLGDGARVFARRLRLRLWREHLGLADDADDTRLLEPVAGFEAWAASAARLQAWHHGGHRGPRPTADPAAPGRAGPRPQGPLGPGPVPGRHRPRRSPPAPATRHLALISLVLKNVCG